VRFLNIKQQKSREIHDKVLNTKPLHQLDVEISVRVALIGKEINNLKLRN